MTKFSATIGFCLLVGMTMELSAQTPADPAKLQQALNRAQGLLRQVGQQKATLEVDLAKKTAELGGLKKKLRLAETQLEETTLDLESSERAGERTSAHLQRAEETLKKTRGKLQEVVERYKELNKLQQRTEAERQMLAANLENTEAELKDAEGKNLALYKTNMELVDLYRNKTPLTGALQLEPFTGLKNVEVQNRIQDYEYQMFDQLRDTNLQAGREARKRDVGE